MVKQNAIDPPKRITDLVTLLGRGSQVTIHTSFEILPVDFQHKSNPFQAYIFLCRYDGAVDNEAFSFRKCYARGCPHNLCPHVSQAVMIANRYLQRDYHRLKQAGMTIDQQLFTLEGMTVRFDDYQEKYGPLLTIHDYIAIANEGNKVEVAVNLEFVPAVEHFARHDNAQTFLNGEFEIETLGRAGYFQRCFACYGTETEGEEKAEALRVANRRLELLYDEFDAASIVYEKMLFE
jgi:hypothetical protein